jgi:hypothetical protein
MAMSKVGKCGAEDSKAPPQAESAKPKARFSCSERV